MEKHLPKVMWSLPVSQLLTSTGYCLALIPLLRKPGPETGLLPLWAQTLLQGKGQGRSKSKLQNFLVLFSQLSYLSPSLATQPSTLVQIKDQSRSFSQFLIFLIFCLLSYTWVYLR